MSPPLLRHPLKYPLRLAVAVALLWLLVNCSRSDDDLPLLDLSKRIDEQSLASRTKGENTTEQVLQFGFDLRSSPQEDARQYLPFLAYLSHTTGYHFKLHFTSPSSSIIDELGSGEVQFAAIGATSYLEAQMRYGVTALVRGLNAQGRAEYQSVLVVQPGSKIERVTDLRDKRMAFGPYSSTQGHLIPRITLQQHGLTLKDLAAYDYTASHRECANAVITGKYDVCGMQDTMGRTLATEGLVRIIHTSDYFPSSAIAANRAVPAELITKVTAALVAFDPLGRDGDHLYHWQSTEMPNGFILATAQDYDLLRHWALEFGILRTETPTQ